MNPNQYQQAVGAAPVASKVHALIDEIESAVMRIRGRLQPVINEVTNKANGTVSPSSSPIINRLVSLTEQLQTLESSIDL